jgi:hypothetical protein
MLLGILNPKTGAMAKLWICLTLWVGKKFAVEALIINVGFYEGLLRSLKNGELRGNNHLVLLPFLAEAMG